MPRIRVQRYGPKPKPLAVILLAALVYTTSYLIITRGVKHRQTRNPKYDSELKRLEALVNPNLGHLGEPAYLEGALKLRGDESVKGVAINTVLSDRIPLNRTLRDYRNKKCPRVVHEPSLTASIVVIFHNEPLSVLLRTVWSVILRSPRWLLHEFVLVDDASTNETLKGFLDYYVEARLSEYRVQIVRLGQRQGLIRARLHGARRAEGDVLVFLDAHCEATVGWLEPLLARIQEDRTVVAMPIIDLIVAETLAYTTFGDFFLVGGFAWAGFHIWIEVQDETDKAKVTPVKSPTMQGGLFAIERNYFWEMGSYDDQMDGWGGENIEMSFRIWQCGGRLEVMPCSRVGHVYRLFHPYRIPGDKDTNGINTARTALVWMDEYKRLYFRAMPQYENNPIVGDLTERKRLRERLRCRSFRWYLTHVYPEKFIPDEHVQAHGQVRVKTGSCLDTLQLAEGREGPLGLYGCYEQETPTQIFTLTFDGQLRTEDFCAEGRSNNAVVLDKCYKWKSEQHWVYHASNGTVGNSKFALCLSSRGVTRYVILEECNGDEFQKWTFNYVNTSAFVFVG